MTIATVEEFTDLGRLVEIAFDAYGDDSAVLTDTRADYLIMAQQAIAAEQKRSKRAPRRPTPIDR